MHKGTVKYFNATRGTGLITPSNGEQDISVHVSGLQTEITKNDIVTYDIQVDQKGFNAINVRIP